MSNSKVHTTWTITKDLTGLDILDQARKLVRAETFSMESQVFGKLYPYDLTGAANQVLADGLDRVIGGVRIKRKG